MRPSIKKTYQYFLGVLVLAAVVVGIALFSRPQAVSDQLKVYFLNVGQGDAEYIKTPSGQDILIDGGPDNSVLNELGKVMDFGDREISLVVLSHPHADHLTGLVEVLKRYKVDEIWESGVAYSSATYDSWKAEIKNKKISDKLVQAGGSKNFGDVKVSVLYPLSLEKNRNVDNLNNSSVVAELQYYSFSVLFTGDLEKNAQQQIYDKLHAVTVLKAAHHGSANGIDDNLLEVTRPSIAVIEVGAKNTYGHPASSAINLLKKYAVRIFRTDQNGTIEIDSNGQAYTLKSAR